MQSNTFKQSHIHTDIVTKIFKIGPLRPESELFLELQKSKISIVFRPKKLYDENINQNVIIFIVFRIHT